MSNPFTEKKCPICGKKYIPAALHIYKVKGVLVCSYTCQQKGNKEKGHREK